MGVVFYMNYKHFSKVYTDESQFSREKLQFFFDKAIEQEDETYLRNHYRALRDLDFSSDLDFPPQSINISYLCENITSAFDVFSYHTGKSFIYCGNTTHSVYGNHRLISKAFLNLLSNAYLYGTNSLVTVKTIEEKDFIKVEVQNSGIFNEKHSNRNGLSFVRRVCKSMNGHFFIETDSDYVKAIMFLKKSENNHVTTLENYSFTEFLTDRLSPVYVEVFGMEYH